MLLPSHITLIANTLGIAEFAVKNTIKLFEEGATLPFIARYRKEMTGSLDEVQLSNIQKQAKKIEELEARKLTILEAIMEQQKLTPELKGKILATYDANELEDIYLPYKKKKKTRADIARELGLEPLAKLIMSQRGHDIAKEATRYVNAQMSTPEAAIQGAQDIIAEWISEDQNIRELLRVNFRKFAKIQSKVVAKMKESATNYQDYFDFEESVSRCPSHRFLAMMRGKNEGMLRVSLSVDDDRMLEMIDRRFIRSNGQAADLIADAISDSYKRLLFSAIETQIINEYKEKSDDAAILVFVENLRQLLLAAPLGQKSVLAIDPGFRTGCKVVCLDVNGEFLEYKTVFPNEPQKQTVESEKVVRYLVDTFDIEAVAIGNGTASRETKSWLQSIRFDRKPEIYVVNESGASIYSASDVARVEFPDQDVTVRGAISIGRRLIDPLAELVKIDAKSIGVGQYQHDVHQGKLKENLDMTVVSCVNTVGINLNTASEHILTYVAGIGSGLAKNILKYRRENGDFTKIEQLKSVPRLGEKAFEQASGFLRIRDGENPLDNTGVHPESYPLVRKMAKSLNMDVATFIKSKEHRDQINLNDFITEKAGLPTLHDIMNELDKPGLDPRGSAHPFNFDERVKSIEDVHADLIVPGIVTNMTNFGAFVDIGAKQDALLHISQITNKFIQNPAEVLHLGQELQVKVLSVDIVRKRINLTLLF
jgi:uncharacterized protein